MVYLDNAATTMPKPPMVESAIMDALRHSGSLGRGSHASAAAASEIAFSCRCLAGEMFDVSPEHVAFTFNATHGSNIAIRSIVGLGDDVVVSGFEHNAVMRPLYALGANISIAGRKLFDREDTLQEFSRCVTARTKAVICTHVSNVYGYILPLEQIAELCKERNVPLIVDAAQSAGVLPLSMRELGAAFIFMPGHKSLFGPQGTGLLLCGCMPRPILEGGTGSSSKLMTMPAVLPDRVEAGTQNIHGIAGLVEGMRFVQRRGIGNIAQHEKELVDLLTKELSKIDDIQVLRGTPMSQSGVVSMCLKHMSCEEAAQRSAAAGIAVRSGLHCAPVAHESGGTIRQGTLRVSFSALSNVEDVETFVSFMKKLK